MINLTVDFCRSVRSVWALMFVCFSIVGCQSEERKALDMPTVAPSEKAEVVDAVRITTPSAQPVIDWEEPSIVFAGTKPAYSGVWISQQVNGEFVLQALVVPRSSKTKWHYTLDLQKTDGLESTVNQFVFKAYKGQDRISSPVSVTVNYKPSAEASPSDSPGTPEIAQAIPQGMDQLTSEHNRFNSIYPQVASGINGQTYVVWQQCQTGDSCDKTTVMAARHMGASGWGTPVEVSPLSSRSAHGIVPDVAVDSTGIAHIVWTDSGTIGKRRSSTDVIYRTWDGTNAAGLGDIDTVSVGAFFDCERGERCAEVYEAVIALAGDSPRVAFRAGMGSKSYDIFYASRSDYVWNAVQLSQSGDYIGGLNPQIAADLFGGVHVVWQHRGKGNTSSLHYTEVGQGMGSISVLTPQCGEKDYVARPTVAADAAGKAYVAWLNKADCNDDAAGMSVFYAEVDESGHFSEPRNVTVGGALVGATHQTPQIDVAEHDSSVVITWASTANIGESGDDYDILMKRFKGEDATEIQIVNELASTKGDTTKSLYPSLSTDSAGYLTCWQERDRDAGSDFDVNCARREW